MANNEIKFDRYRFDVVVIGAGGAGLRAAVEARQAGLRVAIICKSLFGKAHTVMAEGGAAAAMGNVNENDGWKVHFRDTMRGGKFLNHFRMAELHAKESPDRIWELEMWGALFDRTKEGKISQRNFGGHEYPRLAHVGDRTGLERRIADRGLGNRIVAHLPAEERARQLAVLEFEFHRALGARITAAARLGPFPRARGRSVGGKRRNGDQTGGAKRREEFEGGFHGCFLGNAGD